MCEENNENITLHVQCQLEVEKELLQKIVLRFKLPSEQVKMMSPTSQRRSWRQPKIWSEVTKVTWQEGVCQALNAGSWYWSHFLHSVPQDYVAVSHLWSMWDSISHFSNQQINTSALNPTLSLQFILNCKHQFAWISVFSFQSLWMSPVKMVTIRAQLKP